MGYTNDYELPEWTHPSDYGGFSPDDDFVIAAVNRDSKLWDRCNWKVWEEWAVEMNAKHPERENPDLLSGENAYIYEFRASHWAVGWVDYMLIRRDAPDEIQKRAYDMLAGLQDYPLLDEEKHSQMEYEEVQELWENSDDDDRIYWLDDVGLDSGLVKQESCPEGLFSHLSADL